MTKPVGRTIWSSLLALIGAAIVQVQVSAAIPLQGPLNITGANTTGEGVATLTVAAPGAVVRLEGAATKGGVHEENRLLNATVFDFRLPASVELPPGRRDWVFPIAVPSRPIPPPNWACVC